MKEKTINRGGIRITLLLISLCQLGSLAISSVISDITKAFPDVTDQTAQFLMTFPGLFILISSLLSAGLTRFISQKKLAVAGLILNVMTAVCGLLFHGSVVLLFCWAAALGLGLSRSLFLYMIFTVIGGMSLPLVLPQASLGVVENKKPEQFAMASAVLMAFGNLGAFCSPLTTSAAAALTGSAAISVRLIFCAAAALTGALIAFFVLRFMEEN